MKEELVGCGEERVGTTPVAANCVGTEDFWRLCMAREPKSAACAIEARPATPRTPSASSPYASPHLLLTMPRPRPEASAGTSGAASPPSGAAGASSRGGKRGRGRGGTKLEPPFPHPASSAQGGQASASNGDSTVNATLNTSKGSKKAGAATSNAAATSGRNAKKNKKKKKEEGAEARVKLKVVVRRLPPNLPEEIFWKSVEPWTGKQTLGPKKTSVGQATKAKDVKVKQPEATQPGADESTTIGEGQDVEMKDGDAKPAPDATHYSAEAKPMPVKAGPLIDLGSPGQEKLAWRRYLPGKFKSSGPTFGSASASASESTSAAAASRDPSILHTYSRAYLRFKSLPDLVEFHRNFDGHVFRDAAGNQSVALVEWAPYQKCPPLGATVGGGKKRDKKEGSIEEDPDYLEFVKTLAGSAGERGEGGASGEKSREKTDAELMAHLTSSHASRDALHEASKHTPLLEHLRNQKKAEAASKASARGKGVASGAGAAGTKGKLGKGSGSQAHATAAATANRAGHAKEKGKGKASSAAQPPAEGSAPAIPTGPKSAKKDKSKAKASGNPVSKVKSQHEKDAAISSAPSKGDAAPAATPTGPKSDKKQKPPGKKANHEAKGAGATGQAGAQQPTILKRAGGQESTGAPAPPSTSTSTTTSTSAPASALAAGAAQEQQARAPPTGPKNAGRGGGRGGRGGGGGGRGGRGGGAAAGGGGGAAPT